MHEAADDYEIMPPTTSLTWPPKTPSPKKVKRLRRMNAFYDMEDTSVWPEYIDQARNGYGPLKERFDAIMNPNQSPLAPTELDEMSSSKKHDQVSMDAMIKALRDTNFDASADALEVAQGHSDSEDDHPKKPLSPMSDTTTLILGETMGHDEEKHQENQEAQADKIDSRPVPTPLSNLEKEHELEKEKNVQKEGQKEAIEKEAQKRDEEVPAADAEDL